MDIKFFIGPMSKNVVDSIINFQNKYSKKIISAIQVKKQEDVKSYLNVEKESDIILWDSSGLEKSISWNFDWIKPIQRTTI